MAHDERTDVLRKKTEDGEIIEDAGFAQAALPWRVI
jgi:hypothetical protein